MRVAIVNLTAGGLSGGYLKYLRRMVPLLASHASVNALTVFAPDAVRTQLLDRDQPVVGGRDWPVVGWPRDDARRGFAGLKRAVRDARPDVVFIPTANWLDFGGVPAVVMVRNMEPLEVPFGGNPLREAARNLARRAAARRACRRAARVIAVSDHVRRFLLSRWGLPSDRVSLVYHGVDVPDAADTVRAPSVPGRDLPGDFLFAAGSIRPARGLMDLVDALPLLRASGLPHAAIVAGSADRGTAGHQQRLAARARQLGVDAAIVWAGSLDEAAMRWCYRSCRAFVMTSRAEACPNIALEAMSHGCAAVSVDRPPMPEFFGDAAEYYRAGDARALTQAVDRLLRAPAQADRRAAAAARARAFEWRETADRTAAELRIAVHS